jgi:hypothetical protein
VNGRIRRAYGALLAGATLTVTLLASLAPLPVAAAAPAPADEVGCARYLILGMRGSGQVMDGIFEMGKTVGPYARVVYDNLPDGQRLAYSVPYEAAPVGFDYPSSVSEGALLLTVIVRHLIATCSGVRIGIIGFSQGAHATNLALQQLSIAERATIAGVLLLADPHSAGDTYYDRHSTIVGGPGTHSGAGVLNRVALPPDIQGRATDFCITGDPVCDAPEQKDLAWVIATAVFLHTLHGRYPECCGDTFRAPDVFGFELAQRMLRPQAPPPVQCNPAAPAYTAASDRGCGSARWASPAIAAA